MKPLIQPSYFTEPPASAWTKPVWDRELARLIDSTTSEKYHIAPTALMETAGRAIVNVAVNLGALSHPVLVLCGQGNNAGDGLVAARLLSDKGANVFIMIVKDLSKSTSPLFSDQLKAIQSLGLAVMSWSPGALNALNLSRPIIIDAISGIGFKPPCEGAMLQALREASQIKDATVIAVDTPSGTSADDGTIVSTPLTAHETVTFGSSKPIHRLMPAAACCGHVNVVDIGFPHAAVVDAQTKSPPIWCEVNPDAVINADPWATLPKHAHKYDRGHVLVVGGSSGKIGAPILSAMAALRSGAGWCSLAIPRGEVPVDMPVPPELTIESLFDGRTILLPQLEEFVASRRVNTIILGPGWMGQSIDLSTLSFLRDFGQAGGRIVLDAGALHGIASLILARGPLPKGSFILTPHHGEWQKLQDIAVAPPLTPDGVHAAVNYAESLGCHLLYKNAAPVIISPEKTPPIICMMGSPTLARAGSGDVLAGIVAAHLAAGCSPSFAAARSYTLLIRAACIAGQDTGEDAVFASDIIAKLGIASRI